MEYFTCYSSPLGPLLLTSDGCSLTGLYLPAQRKPADCIRKEDLPVFTAAKDWLDRYFSGKPVPVSFPVHTLGTDFQRRVWEILRTVPYGEAVSYGQIAKHLSPAMSAQAVGGAVGKNPISIIIPCHRCVGAKGQLTGYAGGLEAKKWLLRHEEETK